MDYIFADDSRVPKPTRSGMGPIVAIGGLHVGGDAVGALEREIGRLCTSVGLPATEQFKWSPGKKEEFLKEHLKGDARKEFFLSVIRALAASGAVAHVVVVDTTATAASNKASGPEEDATVLFLERCEWALSQRGRDALVTVASVGGGTGDASKFLASCVDVMASGTEYVKMSHLPLGVITVPSRQWRLLQAADLITSCITARVGGESVHSPAIFDAIRPLLRSDGLRVGGIGLKVHPDFKHANLYHWLLGDSHWWKGQMGNPLPIATMPHAQG